MDSAADSGLLFDWKNEPVGSFRLRIGARTIGCNARTAGCLFRHGTPSSTGGQVSEFKALIYDEWVQ